MSSVYLPPWCGEFQDHWPWTRHHEDLQLISLAFDGAGLHSDDFARCHLPVPDTIQRSVTKRQAEFLAGRLCAREALHRTLGRTAYPGLREDRAPAWPTGSVGSITHTSGRAAAIVGKTSHYQALGLDAETLLSDQSARDLSRRILTPGERSRFQTELDSQPGYLVTLIFSLKESLFKALYPPTLQRFYFQDAEVLSWTGDGQARLRLLKTLSPDWVAQTELEAQFSADDEHIACVVVVEHP